MNLTIKSAVIRALAGNPRGDAEIDGHPDDGVHTVDVKPLCQEEEADHPEVTDFAQGLRQLPPPLGEGPPQADRVADCGFPHEQKNR